MSTTRRSFLSMIASALVVKPESLILPPNPKQPSNVPWSGIHGGESLLQWTIWDTLFVPPDTGVSDVLFSRPIPSQFAITRLACGFMDDDSVSDLTALFDNLRFQLLADGKVYGSGPVSMLCGVLGIGGASRAGTMIHPPIAPRGDFQLQVMCDPVHVSKVLGVQFVLDGLIVRPKQP